MKGLGALSVNQVVIPVVAVAAASVALFIGINRPVLKDTPANPMMSESAKTPPPISAVPQQAPVQRDTPLATAQQQAKDLAVALTPPPPVTGDGAVPEFDIVHIEPTGEAVVAGRAAPGTTVELLRNGEPHDRIKVDQSGQFAMVPRPLPKGTYELTLRSTQADGKQTTSKQSVAVVLESTSDQPTVALLTPDKPTLVMSPPPAPASAAETTTTVEAVDIEPNGKVHVSGHAHPGSVVRLYLNDSFVTSVTAGPDGHLAVTINEGVAPGKYRVRLDELASKSGAVRARAEVPLNVPDRTATASISTPSPSSAPPQSAAPQSTAPPSTATQAPQQLAASSSNASADKTTRAAEVVVPKVTTMTVVRGDSLWRLSRNSLGSGERYALIYKANKQQIRNPNLIYPGQILVVPANETH
jgi:nucleoid-associated protein YgaU